MSEALHVIAESGEIAYSPILPHLEALIALRSSPKDSSRAEALFRQALSSARSFRAHWHELRPVIGLAELLLDQGRQDEARTELEKTMSCIEQGLETPLVKRVQELLAQESATLHACPPP